MAKSKIATSIFLLLNAIDESIYLSNFDARCSKEIYLKTQLSTKGVKILYQGVILEERDLDTLVLATSLLNKKN